MNIQQGITNLAQDQVDVTVVFPLPFTAAPSVVPFVQNVSDDGVKFFIQPLVTAISTTQFTVHLSAGPNTANYTLAWVAVGNLADPPIDYPDIGIGMQLIRRSVRDQVIANQHTWPLEAMAIAPPGNPVPSEVFVYRAGQQGQAAGVLDKFENVASVHELNELMTRPQVFPDGKMIACYRSARLLFHCRSAKEADDLWNDIVEDVQDLVANFASASALQTEVVITL